MGVCHVRQLGKALWRGYFRAGAPWQVGRGSSVLSDPTSAPTTLQARKRSGAERREEGKATGEQEVP